MYRTKIPTVIVLLLTLLLSSGVSAQQKKLDLEESIRIASDSSLQAYIDQNRYLSSYWEFKSFKAGRLPSVSLNMTPLQYRRDFVRRYDSEQDIDVYRWQQSLYSGGNLSIKQNVDLTGGTFYVDSELGYLRNFGENNYTQFSAVPVRVGYNQSLFGFNDFKWQKKIEPLKFDKAQSQFLYSREEIAESVISYFFDLVMAQMEYDIAEETVQSSDTLFRIGQKRNEIMSISQADLLTLKLDMVNARNSFVNAKTNYQRSEFSFVRYLNLPSETSVLLEIPDKPKNIIISGTEALRYAYENNPNYLNFSQQLLEAEQSVERTEKSSNFDANISVSVGFNQIADHLAGAYRNPLQQDMVNLSLTIPLVDWGVRKGRANMAKNNRNVIRLSIEQQKQSLEQDVIMTVNEFNIQQNQITSAEEALELARMAYDSTKDRFLIGKADLNSMTLSLNRLNTAQRNYVVCLRSYWLSFYKLRRLTLFDFVKEKRLSVDLEDLNRKAAR